MAVFRYPNIDLIDTCFTIGATEAYDKYIAESNDPRNPPHKATGGTVWNTLEEAVSYLNSVDRLVTLDDGTKVPASVYEVGLPNEFAECTEFSCPFFSLTCPGVLLGRCNV